MGTARDGVSGGSTRHLSHQWGDEGSLSETVVAAVADDADEDRESLPPIDRSVNPDALDELFDTSGSGIGGCVTFSYYGYTIVVQSTGRILIREN